VAEMRTASGNMIGWGKAEQLQWRCKKKIKIIKTSRHHPWIWGAKFNCKIKLTGKGIRIAVQCQKYGGSI